MGTMAITRSRNDGMSSTTPSIMGVMFDARSKAILLYPRAVLHPL